MAAQALAAQAVASRLQRQEEDIRWLCAEVQRLRDEQLRGSERGQAEGPRLTREVAQLRAENRDLRQRLSGLRLRLAEQRDPGARRAAAQEVTRRASGDAAQAHALGGGLQLSAPRRRGQGCRVCPRRRPARCLRPRGNRWVFTQPPNGPAGAVSQLLVGETCNTFSPPVAQTTEGARLESRTLRGG